MASPSTLLLGACVCGEPIFRHRTIDGRQIACAAVRRLDEALRANAQPRRQSRGEFQFLQRVRELARQTGVR